MTATRAGRNDPCPCGSGKKYKHCCLSKTAPAPAPSPAATVPARQLMEAFGLFQAGRLQDTAIACERLLRIAPGQPDVLHLKALVLHRQGQTEQALALVERALAAAPGNDSIHATRGILWQSLGRLDEAADSFRRAIALNGRAAAAHSNLGVVLELAGRLDDAVAAFERALAIEPKFVPALSGLGSCLIKRGDTPAALACLERALAIDPNSADVHIHLGNAHWQWRRLEAAEQHYRAALRSDPGQVLARDNLATVLLNANRTDEAAELLRQAQQLRPELARRIRLALMLPQVYESAEAMRAWRGRFERGLDELAAEGGLSSTVPLDLYSTSLFNLAYHAMDDRALLQRIAGYYRQVLPSLSFTAQHVGLPRVPGSPLRLGFFSAHVYDHPVAHSFAGLVEALARNPGFDVHLISQHRLDDESVRRVYAGFSGHWVQVGHGHAQASDTIAALGLDVLVYQDIGMEALSYFLAFSRLARWQCVVGGHPQTTGIDTVDGFVSSALAEPPEAQMHYTEALTRLPIGAFHYRRPQVPAVLKGRTELGLPAEGRLYLCPMMLQKIHPDFDVAIGAILDADPQGQVVLFRHAHAPWHEALMRRFEHSIAPALRQRLHFLPWIASADDFLAVNACADVVLDPFHFGIGSTAIATFAVGTPIVTWPGQFMRGRVGLAYCRLLGLDEGIATDRDDYAVRAVRIARDAGLRAELSGRIRAHQHRLYDNPQVTDDLIRHFSDLAVHLDGGAQPPADAHPARGTAP